MSTFVLLNQGSVVGLVNESPWTGTPKMKEFPGIVYDEAMNIRGSDMTSFEQATKIAAEVTTLTGVLYIAFDNGEWTSHRFGIIDPPQVGDEVSYSFNGDSYPDGKIVRITKNWMVVTDTGSKYNRKRQTSGWMKVGGTWSLIKGHIFEQNPEF